MKRLLISGIAIIFGSAAAVAFPFSTSFEAPDWTTGPANQNGWIMWGNSWEVVDTFARTGTQSVRWENPPGGIWLESPSYGVSGITTHTSVWVHITGNTATTRRFGLQAFGDPTLGTSPAITFRSDGQIWANTTSGTQVFTGLTVPNPTDRWIEVSLQIDIQTGGAVVGSVDGQSVNMFNVTGATPGLGSVDLYTTGTGDGVVFFDDYAAVPEPATMLALAAGLGVLAARRRRR